MSSASYFEGSMHENVYDNQGQVPQSYFFNTMQVNYATFYPIMDVPPQPFDSFTTIPTQASFYPYVDSYGASPSYGVPNNGGPSSLRPGADMALPMFNVDHYSLQDSLYPFAGMFFGHPQAVSDSLPSEMPEEAVLQAQQTQDQVPQQFLPAMTFTQPSGSVHGQGYETSAGFHLAPSVPEVQPVQWESQSGTSSEQENMTTQTPVHYYNSRGDEVYRCLDCDAEVLVRRRKHHNKRHDPNEGLFVCRICEVHGEEYPPLSRKDALKRHIEVLHHDVMDLLQNVSLRLLRARPRNAAEDLEPLVEAINHLRLQNAAN